LGTLSPLRVGDRVVGMLTVENSTTSKPRRPCSSGLSGDLKGASLVLIPRLLPS
jgi:hypothetical protein